MNNSSYAALSVSFIQNFFILHQLHTHIYIYILNTNAVNSYVALKKYIEYMTLSLQVVRTLFSKNVVE